MRVIFFILFFFPAFTSAQCIKSKPADEILLDLKKLKVFAKVLYVAAHPDDENTALLAYLANERLYETAYLSLNKGEGGQNLIGKEQGRALGLIRKAELLEARKIDGARQFFTSAYDFGYSKNPEDTFKFWNRQQLLDDVIRVIQEFRPDIIITRFPVTGEGGHGQHTVSAILAEEAFEQTKIAKSLFFNNFSKEWDPTFNEDGKIPLEIGLYNPLLGMSYGEIAATSRSSHKSQGFGTTAKPGQITEYFSYRLGEKVKKDLFEGIDESGQKISGVKDFREGVNNLIEDFSHDHPERSLKQALKLLSKVEQIADEQWRELKINQLKQIIFSLAALKLELLASNAVVTEALNIPCNLNLTVRSDAQLKLQQLSLCSLNNKLNFSIAEQSFSYECPLQFKTLDPLNGDRYQDVVQAPAVAINFARKHFMFPGFSKKIKVKLIPSRGQIVGSLKFNISPGWKVSPAEIAVNFKEPKEQEIELKISRAQGITATATIHAQFQDNESVVSSLSRYEIGYEHIPHQIYFEEAKAELHPISIRNNLTAVGYLLGAGDDVPESLEEIGIKVDQFDEHTLPEKINSHKVMIVGVRAFNVSKDPAALTSKLLNFVKDGGTLLVQYQTNNRLGPLSSNIGPYPLTIASKLRVTDEEAEVKFSQPKHRVLTVPNLITEADFKGWIQERGLYFAETIDPKYQTPLLMHDANEADTNGSLLIANYGKGRFIYTGLSFFRELPAGVAGAYRLFVNLLIANSK
jgi:LmbE family N-acetylglucosaminyl deacetylase